MEGFKVKGSWGYILLLLSFFYLAKVEAGWFSSRGIASPGKPMVSLLRADPTGIEVEIRVRGFNYDLLSTKGGRFSQISIPEYGFNREIGKPQLPVIRELVEIPYEATPSLQIVSLSAQEYGLQDLGLEYPILPCQPSRRKGVDGPSEFFIDNSFYSQAAFYPERPVRISPGGVMRGHRFITLEVYPFLYNPGEARVKLITQLKLQINLSGSDLSSTEANLKRLYSPSWERLAQNAFLNYGTYESFSPKVTPVAYLIVSADSFWEVVQPLRKWIGEKGFSTFIAKTSEIGPDTASIRAFISNAYHNWENPPAYVLLVGEGDLTGGTSAYIQPYPGRYPLEGHKANATDLYYSTVDGSDLFPDIGIGRLSVKTSDEAGNVVDKVLSFEKLVNSHTDWLSRAAFIASNENHELTEGTHNEMALTYFEPLGVLSTMVYSHFGGNTSDIDSALNQGQIWINYSGHGTQTGWQDPGYYLSNIENLTNQGMYPFVISNACLTGTYNYSVCQGEEWLRARAKGAVGFWGASNYTYWDEDDVLERGLYLSGFGEGLHTLCEMTNGAKLKLFQHYGLAANVKYYFEVYNLLGEPSLDLFIGAPDTFVVSHNDTFPLLAQTMEVAVDQDSALVALYKDGITYGVTYSQGGYANVDIYPQISSPGTLYVTVTKHNFKSYMGKVLVISPANSTINPDSIPINASTWVRITVLSQGTARPLPNVEVAISGWGVSLLDTTNSQGEAYLTLAPPYGEVLSVKGRREGEDYNLFADSIWVVGGLNLSSPTVSASVPSIGLIDTLTPNFFAGIRGITGIPGFSFFIRGCGIDTSLSTSDTIAEVEVTPDTLGSLRCVIAKFGFNIFQKDIPVINAYGRLSGVVYDSLTGDSLDGVRILGFPGGADTSSVSPIFQLDTDGDGRFQVGEKLSVGEYDLYLTRFGYSSKKETILLRHNVNEVALGLNPAPQGKVGGVVYDSSSGEPLSATIRIFTKGENPQLYAIIQTDSAQGGSFSTELPYFDYLFKVSSWQHLPQTATLSVEEDSLEKDFRMSSFADTILVVDDETGGKQELGGIKAMLSVKKLGETKPGESAQAIARYLHELNLNTKLELSSSTDPSNWTHYPFIIWSDGQSQSPVALSTYRDALEAYVANGGKLLIEGGELGFDSWVEHTNFHPFAQNVLHIAGWEGDEAGDLNLVNSFSNHPIARYPNRLPFTLGITFDPYDWGDQDASVPAEDAFVIYQCKEGDAGVLVYDPTPDPQGGQIVFYSFNLLALTDSLQRKNLLENTCFYLLANEKEPQGLIRGMVDLRGSPNDGGAVVTLTSGAFSTADTTSADGGWHLGGLYQGSYTLRASKEGYEDTLISVLTVSYDETMSVNLILHPRVYIYFSDFDSDSGALSSSGDWQWGKPQYGPGGAHSDSNLWATNLQGPYSDYSNSILDSPPLYFPNSTKATLEFWHWYDSQDADGGNLKISVNGGDWQIIDPEEPYPQGWVPLDNSGIPGQRCYAGEGTSWQKASFDLTPYVGEGDTAVIRWQFGSNGSGTKAGWYIDDVRVSYVDYTVGVQNETSEDKLPTSYALFQNYPNPFNATTVIRYSLPVDRSSHSTARDLLRARATSTIHVRLEIYNILGRKVATLVDGKQTPGYKAVTWDARRLASGIYFCRLRAGGFQGVRKLLLLK